jgi:hypothetical protein
LQVLIVVLSTAAQAQTGIKLQGIDIHNGDSVLVNGRINGLSYPNSVKTTPNFTAL